MNLIVSGLMSLYEKNDPILLKFALDSFLFKQTHAIDQFVVVYDGPIKQICKDVVNEARKKFGKDKFKIVNIKANVGLSNALNEGMSFCEGALIARMDSDDIAHPLRIERQVKAFLNNPELEVVGTWAKEIDVYGSIVGHRSYPVKHCDIKKFAWANPVAHPSVMFRRNTILDIGGYQNNNKNYNEDMNLWFRVLKEGYIIENIPEFLIFYRVPNTLRKKRSLRIAIEQFRLSREIFLYFNSPGKYYVYLYYPIFLALIPNFLLKFILRYLRKYDVRFHDDPST